MKSDFDTPADQNTLHSGVWSSSFQGLLWTQWLTAVNDNVFRWFVIGVGKDQFTPENVGTLLVVGSSFFIVPYILFASVAGWLADRYKKSKVIIGCKIAEIVIMVIGVVAVGLMGEPDPQNRIDPLFWLLLGSVFLMGMQSALFAPAKVGTIPELLDENNIAAGNGIFNLATLSATVIGMAAGGWLSDVTDGGQSNMWIAAVVLVGIAIVGTALSFLVKSLPAANVHAKFPVSLIGETISDIIQLVKTGPLFRVALGVVFFWSIAAFAQLNIDFFADESGGLLESHRTPLLIAVVLGIGLGSVFAGYVSAGKIELGLVPWGALGISIFAFMLWLSPVDLINENPFNWKLIVACTMLLGLGMAAGMFDVPLASYLQNHSPIKIRGSILAATNCLAFSGILVMFGLLILARKPTFEGSLANLPSSLTTQGLTDDQQKMVEMKVQDYLGRDSWVDSPPQIKTYSDEVPSEIRPALISELVYSDAVARKEAGQSAMLDDYTKDFDEARARSIKKAYLQSGKLPLLTSRQIFLLMGILAIPVIVYSTLRLARPAVRLFFLILLRTLYRVKVVGAENIHAEGAAVVTVNHTSWLDGVIILVFVPRIPRTIAWAGNFDHWALQKWADFCGLILISENPKSIRRGLTTAREALNDGQVLGIFPEGGITRTGQVRTFKPGLMKIVDKKHPVPIIPVYFHETWGSIFSYYGRRAITRFPNSIRRPLSVHIGKPVENPDTMFPIHQAVQRLSAEAVKNEVGKFSPPAKALIKRCKKKKFKFKLGDSTGQDLTGGMVLTRALILRKLLRQFVLQPGETNVGVLIPPSVGGAIVNATLSLDKRVVVNLNYTLSEELVNHCIRKAGIKHVLTTRRVWEKFEYNLDCEVVFLDDLREKVSGLDKALAAFQSFAVPAFVISKMLGLGSIQPDDLKTIVFTSGSTGVPKGVMLTQRNVMSNVDGIEQIASLVPTDTLIGILPFFHSMGYTVTLWAPLACDICAVYHFNPLDSKTVGKLTEKHKGTVLIATPTFLRSYMRRCTPEQFKTLDVVVAGAERLPPEICEEFESKFGVRPVEGYGTTELSPVSCVNVPSSRQFGAKFQIDSKEGTVGRPMPHVAAKVTNLDTGEELGPNEPGMLWIKGPNVMKGYLDLPEETAEAIVDDWYQTGDVALIDDDGFVKITGRMSRFSKIGGEMVPHLKIEEVLSALLDETPDDDSDDHLTVAVTAVPCPKKGERIVVLHTKGKKTPADMLEALKAAELPNIFLPSEDSFFEVEGLPLLGTGKLDLRGIKELALELTEKSES